MDKFRKPVHINDEWHNFYWGNKSEVAAYIPISSYSDHAQHLKNVNAVLNVPNSQYKHALCMSVESSNFKRCD